MQELFQKLGINWKLILAQAANFLIILTVLRFTVYKPLIRILNERKRKIQEGFNNAEEAKRKLDTADSAYREKIAEAEKESLILSARMEKEAEEKEEEILREAKLKQAEILAAAEKAAQVKKKEIEENFYKEAAGLVKSAVAKTVELNPSLIEDSLISEAIKAAKKTKQ